MRALKNYPGLSQRNGFGLVLGGPDERLVLRSPQRPYDGMFITGLKPG
jgi:hypothetical protein